MLPDPSPNSPDDVLFSLVVPVYRNEETIPQLVARVNDIARAIGGSMEGVFVVDGSPDNSSALLEQELARASFPSHLIELSRNFGAFTAIRAGLAAAHGRHFAVMAADLQEPAELIIEFFRVLREEGIDIVVGSRRTRQDPWPSRAASTLFWDVHRRLIQPETPAGGVDVFGCSARVRDLLLAMPESNTSLVGLLFWVGFRRLVIPYDRQPRASGRSAWSLRRKLRYMLDSMFAFTDLPIILLIWVGAFGTVLSLISSVVVFWAWASGQIPVLGYTPLIITLLLSVSVILFALGIIGGYVWRTYENSKRRPLFIESSRRSFGRSG